MAKLTRAEREEIARRRILRVLRSNVVVSGRTLEQKISDAGPFPQRVDPHILTAVRAQMIEQGILSIRQAANLPWLHTEDTPRPAIDAKLAVLTPVYTQLTGRALRLRTGQTLEIATYRALSRVPGLMFFGRFADLDTHDDSTLFRKEEPPQHVGNAGLDNGQNLDFMAIHKEAGPLGIECKNVREWLYPDRDEVRDTISKCLAMDCVPVLIARRIPFVTFKVLSPCGVIVHQTYNQLMPATAEDIARQAMDKNLLGYHDIRLGNVPDERLLKFIGVDLMAIAPAARERFEQHKDLLGSFASRDMSYAEFAARVRRRANGQDEDFDHDKEAIGDPADWD